MPAYEYRATDDGGKKTRGVLEAANETELQRALKTQGQYLLSSRPVRQSQSRALKAQVLAEFSRQMGSLVGAGVSLVRTLSIIADEEGLNPAYRKLYLAVLKSVRQGNPLSRAMEEQGRAFPPLMIHMYRSAEASGNLEQTALKMADHYEKDHKLNGKVKSAFTYPKILSGLIVVVVIIIMTYVMPQFRDMFAALPSLPLSTRVLFAVSDFVTHDWLPAILIVAAAVILVRAVFRIPRVRYYKDMLLVKTPKLGRLLSVIYTARFSRTLSSLYACGISIVSALQTAKSVVGNTYIESQFDDLIAWVRAGNSLSDGLAQVDGFSKKLSSSVKVGEESGNLESLLVSLADSFDYDAEITLNKLVALLEPAMLILMAIIVAVIMFAVIMPIYNSYSTIS